MKLIKASYKIMTSINGEEILKQIELAALNSISIYLLFFY
jgi:hypothetical protein